MSRKGLISNSCGSICTSVERYGRTRNSSLWSSFSWVGLQIEGQFLITYPCSTALRRGLSLICYFKIIALIFTSLSWTLNFHFNRIMNFRYQLSIIRVIVNNWVMAKILYIDEHQIVYIWRCLCIFKVPLLSNGGNIVYRWTPNSI